MPKKVATMKNKSTINVSKNIFDEMGIFWAEIADQSQTERQIEFIKNILQPEGFVLDLACGTGRHLIVLGKEGYDVVGLDISFELLKIAKSRWQDAQVVRADMRFLPFKPRACVAAVIMDQSFGYLPSDQDDLKSFSELHNALGNDGILIVDLFNRERLIKQSKASSLPKWREYPSFFLQQTRTFETNGERLHDSWVVRNKADGQTRIFEHVARLYTLGSLRSFLEKTGFSVDEIYGDYERKSFSPDSSRLILVVSSK
jgi:SAM-dependent methyltransferase